MKETETSSSRNIETLKLKVIGMDNAHCLSIVTQGLEKLPGIISRELQQNEKAAIVYDVEQISAGKIKQTIRDLGYNPLEESAGDAEKEAREQEIRQLRRKTIFSWIFSLPLLFLAMVVAYFKLPLPAPILTNMPLIQLLLATPVLIAGRDFYYYGLVALWKTRTATMDTLVAVGTGTAYVYSLILTLLIWFGNTSSAASVYTAHDLYYEVAALLIAFILLGRYLEAKAKGRTSEAIKRLLGLQPKTARVIKKGT